MEKSILKVCMEKGFLLDKEVLQMLSDLDEGSARDVVESLENLKIEERVITKSFFSKNFQRIQEVLVNGKNKKIIEDLFISLGYVKREAQSVENVEDNFGGKVKVLSSFTFVPKKIVVRDFVNHFRTRYGKIRDFLRGRDLENLTSLRRIDDQGSYTVIVSIFSKRITKNGNLLFEAEDLSGRKKLLVNKNKEEVFLKAKDLLLDDIVAFSVSGNSEWLYANELFFPDSFLQEKRRHDKETLVAFTSDLHVGSKMFLEESFLKFIDWINGEEGDEKQKELAKKVKYLLITGDSVDGVGVNPGQESRLDLKDFRLQYEKLVELLSKIRKDIQIIICPGQHDAVWVGHPQPAIGEEWAPKLCEMENVFLVTNPCLIEIEGGFKILMYHGAGMHAFVNEIEDIRLNYGHNNPARVVKELLKRRHLSPSHGSSDYIPFEKQDPLVIDSIPDIIATGDWHRSEVATYNNILIVASSCWQSITPFEEKVGNNPDPCKVPLLNLKTREIKILDFSEDEDLHEESCEEKEGELVCEVEG